MVTRRDLRAERDFYSPMTGDKSSTYGSQVRSRLEDIKNVKGTRAPAIEAAFVKLLKTEDPFTQIDEKKSYAPDEEDGLMGSLEGLGDGGGGVAEAVEEFIEPFTGGGSTSPNDRRLQRQAESRAASQANTGTGRDGTFGLGTYGKGVPSNPTDGSFNITTVKPKTPEPKTSEKPKYGQGGLKLGTTTQRQGNTIRDGVEGSWGGPAVNVSGHYSDNREKQKNLRMAQAQAKRVTPAVKATGIPTGLNLKAGSFGISQAGKDKAAINKGIAAAKATGIPSGDALKAGSFGISKAGAEQAAKNRAQAQAKAKAQAAKTSSVSTTTKQGKPRTAAQMSAAKRISSGKSISQSKAANRASMKANAAARNASFQAQKKAGTHSTASRTAAGQRARNKAAAKARAKAAAKRRRSKKKCDITIKYDISFLTNNNLRHDELADVAYFVRELQED